MKILCIHAHFDDYEFVAAGTFDAWKRRDGEKLRARLIVSTDGRAGHQFRTREETGAMRLAEQKESAKIGGYELEQLRYPDGKVPREASMQIAPPLLAGMWKAIRDFGPDYLFCPPVAADPLAGVHIDHVTVAEAVRKVAYMINVPHAFTPEYPADETRSEPCPVPVIINCYDGYMGRFNTHDFAVDIEDSFERVCQMAWCHQSQVVEWLPWVGGERKPPASYDEWRQQMRSRQQRRQEALGLKSDRALELFTVTSWGRVPKVDELLRDIPNIVPEASHLDRLRQRLGG